MTITRAQVEYILISRCKNRMAFAEMAVTSEGSNADLNDPLASALMEMGITPSNITSVADSDFSTVTDILKLCDIAELRLLKNIRRNIALVDITVGERSERFSQIAADLDKDIAQAEKSLNQKYGIGSAAVLSRRTFNFQAKDEEE